MAAEIVRGLGPARTDDEPQVSVVQLAQVGRGEHAGIGDHDHVRETVPGLELADDRQDRLRLYLVPLEAADLQREPSTVDQQPDDDLRIDPPFLREAYFAQLIFLLGLEVEGGDVVEDQRHVAVGRDVLEAFGRDGGAVIVFERRPQIPFHGRVAGRLRPEVGQDAGGVAFRGRLDDPGDHKVPEHRIIQLVEPQACIRAGQRVLQQHARRGLHPPRTVAMRIAPRRVGKELALPTGARNPGHCRLRGHAKIQRFLGRVLQPLPGLLQQHAELSIGMRGTDVPKDLLTPLRVLRDLHRRGTGLRSHSPDERHPTRLEHPRLVRETRPQSRQTHWLRRPP